MTRVPDRLSTRQTVVATRGRLLAAGVLVVCVLVIVSVALLVVACGFPTAPAISTDAYEVEDNVVAVTLSRVPELATTGGSASVVSDSPEVYLVIAKVSEDTFAVVSNRCTHNEKALGYDHEAGLFICASGKSEFRPDGTVVKGPAKAPLRTYDWRVEEGRLIIALAR